MTFVLPCAKLVSEKAVLKEYSVEYSFGAKHFNLVQIRDRVSLTSKKVKLMERKECAVTVTVGDKEFSKSYNQIVKSSVTVDDLLTLLQDEKSAKQVISDWHYGQDLRSKAEVRNTILGETAGPEKAFEKSVKDFMKLREANGKPVTEEKAREIVKLMQDMQ